MVKKIIIISSIGFYNNGELCTISGEDFSDSFYGHFAKTIENIIGTFNIQSFHRKFTSFDSKTEHFL